MPAEKRSERFEALLLSLNCGMGELARHKIQNVVFVHREIIGNEVDERSYPRFLGIPLRDH